MRIPLALWLSIAGCAAADVGAAEPRAAPVPDDAALPPVADETDPVVQCTAAGSTPADLRGARDDFMEATRAYDHGDYTAAAALFCRAYRAHPSAVILFDVAQSWESAGEPALAARFYDAAAAAADDGVLADRAREHARRAHTAAHSAR
jgi:hypothetical protein